MRGSKRTLAIAGGLVAVCGGIALAVDNLIPAKIAIVKPANIGKFVAKPTSSFPLPTGPDAPTTIGATLQMFDTGSTAGNNTYTLPQAKWSGLGNPPGSKGFKYKGAGAPGDPCKVVIVKPAVIKAVCKGTDIALNPPFSGNLGIILRTSPSYRYCATLGGTNIKNQAGLLKRKDAPAAGACPVVAPTTTTTTTLPQPVCGNHNVDAGETCDDGNTVDESTVGVDPIPPDACPKNCIIHPCTPSGSTMMVDVNFASAIGVAGIKVFVDYPDGKVSIPGLGNAPSVIGRITNIQTAAGVNGVPNDLDYGLIEVLGSLNPIPTPRLFTITFDTCQGAPPPTAGEFSCLVKNASDVDGLDITGVTCSVSIVP